jgi:hypothetical protein
MCDIEPKTYAPSASGPRRSDSGSAWAYPSDIASAVCPLRFNMTDKSTLFEYIRDIDSRLRSWIQDEGFRSRKPAASRDLHAPHAYWQGADNQLRPGARNAPEHLLQPHRMEDANGRNLVE